MEQKQIEVFSIHGDNYGYKDITAMFWSNNKLHMIQVDYAGHTLNMYYDSMYGMFKNSKGNLKGKL